MQNPIKSKGVEKERDEGNVVAMARCNLPWEIVIEVLLRLPVKSIIRFKCVCKPWLHHMSSPTFISAHLHRTASNPVNQSLLIRGYSNVEAHIALLNPNSSHPPLSLKHPFPKVFRLMMEIVGCINGLVCLSCSPWGRMFSIWNPALNLWKPIRSPDYNQPLHKSPIMVSLGLNFDHINSDYKIMRISWKNLADLIAPRVQVYSVNEDSWKEIKPNFPFLMKPRRAIAILKGICYWTALPKLQIEEVLVWFDMQNEVFKQTPMPEGFSKTGATAQIVDWEGSLACLMHFPTEEHVDVWAHNDVEDTWSRISRIEIGNSFVRVLRMVQFSGNREIVAKDINGRLFLYDFNSKRIKHIEFEEKMILSDDVFNYTESMVFFRGMKQVGKEK